MSERPQSPGEEIANSLSHGIGLAAALVGASFLIVAAIQQGSASFIVGASVFAATMVLLYLASTLYHALPQSRAKGVLLVCDHAAIFLFIAGSYTLFTLGVLRGAWGWTLLGGSHQDAASVLISVACLKMAMIGETSAQFESADKVT